jgi:hypothetical protein
MAALPRLSPFSAYLAMAGLVAAVFVAFTLISEPARREQRERDAALPLITNHARPSLERDFLTTVLGRPRTTDAAPYCEGRACCPTRRTTFGTTAPTGEVIASFEADGYVAQPGDRDIVRPGPFPQVRWTAELDYAGRWKWRRVEVTQGSDVGRPEWPTVFFASSIACSPR